MVVANDCSMPRSSAEADLNAIPGFHTLDELAQRVTTLPRYADDPWSVRDEKRKRSSRTYERGQLVPEIIPHVVRHGGFYVEADEPWTMTREAFVKSAGDRVTFSGKDSYYHPPGERRRILWPATRSKKKVLIAQHRNEVIRALEDGDAVPRDVAAEYAAETIGVYQWPNGFASQARDMFGWLNYHSFNPAWIQAREAGGSAIGIPAVQVPTLRDMQRAEPARWGNHPRVAAALRNSD